jgi:hypothetical protein
VIPESDRSAGAICLPELSEKSPATSQATAASYDQLSRMFHEAAQTHNRPNIIMSRIRASEPYTSGYGQVDNPALRNVRSRRGEIAGRCGDQPPHPASALRC